MRTVEYDPDPPLRTRSTAYVSSIDEAVAVAVRLSFEQAQAREQAERESAAKTEPEGDASP